VAALAPEFEIIPAIDLRGGRCVRLEQGDYSRETVYSEDPVAMARRWEDAGAPRLHVVDLDGAREGRPVNLEAAGRIARAISIPSDFGGGVRSAGWARRVLEEGFQRFSIGTRALDEEFAGAIFREFGEAAIADIASREGRVVVSGWTEGSSVTACDLARRMEALGCRRIIYTDVSRDGTLSGPNLEAMREMVTSVNIPVVASGGVSSIEDILALRELGHLGLEGAIVGKALYDGRLDLSEALRAVRGPAAR
jgi:phosphoribosylformimino-5-aminoimidazole carboxamide ribotide isomerase